MENNQGHNPSIADTGGGSSELTPAASSEPGEYFEVERILKSKDHPKKGKLYYVKWRHYPNSANTWEPPGNFPQFVIEDFERAIRARKMRKLSKNKQEVSSPTVLNQEQILLPPKPTANPILVTDVTTKNSTLTFSECSKSEGFFLRPNRD